jgi:uncharacterized membrane-anchored protein
MSIAARVIRAREAIVDGESGVALAILVELERELAEPERSLRCPDCSLTFRWPGERDRHFAVSGHGIEEAA